jgi:signal transduction histidine kinase
VFKKINRKYIVAFMTIVFISFTALTVMLASIVDDYAFSMKQRLMENTAQSIGSMINVSMRMGHVGFGNMLESEGVQIHDILNRNAENSDSVIFITDRYGKVIVKSDDPDGTVPSNVSPKVLDSVYNGAWDEYSYSSLDGMFQSKYVNCIRPIYIMPAHSMGDIDEFDASSEMLGAIFICSDSRNPILAALGSSFAMTILWIFIISIIAVYFISERMTKPLKEMSRAAKSFAQGRFDVRVPVRGEDEIAELATAFNNMAMSLEKMEENRNTFLSNVSHDLRTPMTTISGFIDGIITGAIPPSKQEHYLGIVSGEVKRLSRLVSSLLDITRLQAGEKRLVKTSFDVCEMARQVLISCEDRIEEKSLDVQFEADEDSMNVIADHDSIHQILYNLVDNAIKFSYDNGRLELSLKQKDKKVFISVKNEGKGIPKNELPYVFDQFYKSDKSRGLDKTGLGLGLYICKTIVDRHGEEIWVKSEENSWCEFVFTLERDK